MRTVFEALYNEFTGTSLDTAVGGRWFPMLAPEGTVVPYCVASIIEESPDRKLTNKFLDLLIEISVCASDMATMQSIYDLVGPVFDECTLTGITGYAQLGTLERDNAHPIIEGGVYRYIIEYRLGLQKT